MTAAGVGGEAEGGVLGVGAHVALVGEAQAGVAVDRRAEHALAAGVERVERHLRRVGGARDARQRIEEAGRRRAVDRAQLGDEELRLEPRRERHPFADVEQRLAAAAAGEAAQQRLDGGQRRPRFVLDVGRPGPGHHLHLGERGAAVGGVEVADLRQRLAALDLAVEAARRPLAHRGEGGGERRRVLEAAAHDERAVEGGEHHLVAGGDAFVEQPGDAVERALASRRPQVEVVEQHDEREPPLGRRCGGGRRRR